MRKYILGGLILLIATVAIWLLIRNNRETDSSKKEGKAELKQASATPQFTKGNRYKHFDLKCEIDGVNMDQPYKVPQGPFTGPFKPENKPIKLIPLHDRADEEARGAAPDPVVFKSFSKFLATDLSMGIPPDVSGASCDTIILTVQNSYARLSTNSGNSYTTLDPTTIFPSNWDVRGPGDTISGPMCCDQVIQYVRSIDRFIWFMQFWGTCPGICGKNKIRVASASPQQVKNSRGTAWTYWDIYSEQLGTGFLDYPDMAFGTNSLYISIDDTRGGGNGGLEVMRLPLAQIRDNQTVNFQFTTPSHSANAYGGHLSQNCAGTVYWVGHNSNSSVRVYSMSEGSNNYSWRDIEISPWNQNVPRTSLTPDNIDWLNFGFPGNAVIGSAVSGNELWMAWHCGPGGGFRNTHIQVVRVRTSDFVRTSQMQIWNDDYAFAYPALAANTDGEVGISLAWGGRNFEGNNAVGILGDFVVWYPQLSDTAITRWGDYMSTRRHSRDGRLFGATGYSVMKDPAWSTGWRFDTYYIIFGRESAVKESGKRDQ